MIVVRPQYISVYYTSFSRSRSRIASNKYYLTLLPLSVKREGLADKQTINVQQYTLIFDLVTNDFCTYDKNNYRTESTQKKCVCVCHTFTVSHTQYVNIYI